METLPSFYNPFYHPARRSTASEKEGKREERKRKKEESTANREQVNTLYLSFLHRDNRRLACREKKREEGEGKGRKGKATNRASGRATPFLSYFIPRILYISLLRPTRRRRKKKEGKREEEKNKNEQERGSCPLSLPPSPTSRSRHVMFLQRMKKKEKKKEEKNQASRQKKLSLFYLHTPPHLLLFPPDLSERESVERGGERERKGKRKRRWRKKERKRLSCF